MFRRLPFSRSRFLLIHLALTSVLLQPVAANSAALGDASVRSSLGQRLDAEVEIASLTATEAESVSVKLAAPEAWSSAGIDLGALQRSLRLSVEKKEGRYRVHVASDLAVNEPFMHLLIELSANGVRTIRQYVLLIDPPSLITAPTTVANAESNSTLKPTEPAAPVSSALAVPSNTSSSVVAADDQTADPSNHPSYQVRRGETLRDIAQRLQPDGVQLAQVMVSLLSRNPDAFVEGNLHRLRNGSVLSVPSAESMRTIASEKARHTLRVQTADFLRYQRQLAERSSTREGVAAAVSTNTAPPVNLQSSGGSVSVKVTETAPPPVAQDKLKLSAPGGSEVASQGTSTKEAVEKVSSDKALADANARIAALEKNIGDMQALLEMKSRVMSEAQQRAEQTTEPKPISQPSPQPSPKQSPKPSSQPLAKPSPSPSASFEDTFALIELDPILSASAAAGLLVLALLWRRQRRKSDRRDDLDRSLVEPTMSHTVIGEAGGRQIDTAHSVFHSNFVPSVSQIDMSEVDAVAEADVYIAYGRDEQAEEILLDALRAHPERHVLRVKLLEIYAARKDHQRFGTLAAELRVLTHGQGADWARAAHIGQSLEPDNYLYKSVTTGAAAAAALPGVHQTFSASPTSAPPMNPAGAAKASGTRDRFDSGSHVSHQYASGLNPSEAAASTSALSDASHVIDFSLEPTSTQGLLPTMPIGPMTQGSINSAMLNTKLELAMACREIGDDAGARDLLNEVASARDPALAQRAQTLLQQLA